MRTGVRGEPDQHRERLRGDVNLVRALRRILLGRGTFAGAAGLRRRCRTRSWGAARSLCMCGRTHADSRCGQGMQAPVRTRD